MKIIFWGTPEFATPCLEALIDSCHQVIAVITQPDKKRGRGGGLSPSPVKKTAVKHGIEVFQPTRIRETTFIDTIKKLSPDLIAVVAYGKILPVELLKIPPKGCINVHASLLPKFRGAAPIHWALIGNEKETGITTMLMDEKMDTGSTLLCKKTEITDYDTLETLSKRLSELGAEALLETIDKIDKGCITPTPQCGEASYARPLTKEDSLIDWSRPAREIFNLVRALHPRPCACTSLNGERVKIIKAKPIKGKGEPGKVIECSNKGIIIGTSSGLISIEELQPENRKPMSCQDYIRGRLRGKGDSVYVG